MHTHTPDSRKQKTCTAKDPMKIISKQIPDEPGNPSSEETLDDSCMADVGSSHESCGLGVPVQTT